MTSSKLQVERFTFPSTDGKTQIAAAYMHAGEAPRAILQIAHGMQEHIERYEDFAKYLVPRGIIVAGNDHLGHGQSVNSPDDLGYFGKGASNLVVGDMHRLRKQMQQKFPGVPYFMLGHSMGSFMLRKYLALNGAGLAGAIVMGTGFTPEGTTKAGLAVIDGLSRLRGDRHKSQFVAGLAFGKDYKPYDMTGNEPERSWLSHNVDNVKAYYADPLCGFPFTLNGYRGLMEAVQFSCKQENVNAIPADLPILLVSGELDPVGAAGAGVRQVHRMMLTAGIQDLTLKLYPDMLHEILNEPDHDVVFADLADWMEARL
jgi:alpha-beta hydrolase superfamily lysophospholipase